jgi:dihydrodipicolinate synthase/N-acetylneuraminate lyase
MSHLQPKTGFGLSYALGVPFHQDSSINFIRLSVQARRSLEPGCSSLTVFGAALLL